MEACNLAPRAWHTYIPCRLITVLNVHRCLRPRPQRDGCACLAHNTAYGSDLPTCLFRTFSYLALLITCTVFAPGLRGFVHYALLCLLVMSCPRVLTWLRNAAASSALGFCYARPLCNSKIHSSANHSSTGTTTNFTYGNLSNCGEYRAQRTEYTVCSTVLTQAQPAHLTCMCPPTLAIAPQSSKTRSTLLLRPPPPFPHHPCPSGVYFLIFFPRAGLQLLIYILYNRSGKVGGSNIPHALHANHSIRANFPKSRSPSESICNACHPIYLFGMACVYTCALCIDIPLHMPSNDITLAANIGCNGSCWVQLKFSARSTLVLVKAQMTSSV